MKNIIILFALIFTISLGFAQDRVGISEVQMSTSKGDQPAFEFFVPDTDAKTVLDAWNKFHKNLKVKPKQDKTQKNYYFSDNAFLQELSENTIDIYTRIYETNGGVRFTCAFDLGGVFISSEKTLDKYNKTKLILNKFYAQMAMDAIVAEIEKELLALESIKKEYDNIDNEIANFDKEIKDYEVKIKAQEKSEVEVESALIDKSSELSNKQKELAAKKDELKEINKAGMVAELTTNMNSIKKTELEATRIEKDIDRKNAEIAALQADISILQNDLEVKNGERAKFEIKIKEIEDRLVSLKIEEKEEKVKLLEQNVEKIASTQTELNQQKGNIKKQLEQQKQKLDKAKEAMAISKETKQLLEKKLATQQAKIKELENLKATIE
ncbi:MAG: hypothetical protein R2753_04820 [Chitinophagales bacterium]